MSKKKSCEKNPQKLISFELSGKKTTAFSIFIFLFTFII